MKRSFLILAIVLLGCKEEKTFADDIVLTFPKDEKLTIQHFNENGNEEGSDLIYMGKIPLKIKVKYFKTIMPEAPPPPKFSENEKKYYERINAFRDSSNHIKDPYFNNEEIEILNTEEDFYDSLSNKNLIIIVKEKDTIPLYKRDYQTREIKKHKAFPVFIKNISSKTLKIPVDASGVALYISNQKRFQSILNSDYTICGMRTDMNPYFELKPSEILIYSFPHLAKGQKKKSKIVFFRVTSAEFKISPDEEIIKKQRTIHFFP